jgi:hypothetical protein
VPRLERSLRRGSRRVRVAAPHVRPMATSWPRWSAVQPPVRATRQLCPGNGVNCPATDTTGRGLRLPSRERDRLRRRRGVQRRDDDLSGRRVGHRRHSMPR